MAKLAIDGGPAVCADRRWPRFLIGEEEKQAVVDLFDRAIREGKAFDRYGGTEVGAYEEEFAAFVGRRHGYAVSSGTAAIHTALGALHLEPGSEVICAPITDPGAIMPVIWQLCIPVFADTAPDSFNMCAEGVERVVSDKTGAIVVGHIAGEPADMAPIMALAKAGDIPVIEDCAQAHGATYRGKKVGAFGLAGAFSTMSGKHHTSAGQGGVVVTDDEDLHLDVTRFSDRGKPFGSDAQTNLFLGINYRVTEIQGAVGRVQLRKLPGIIRRRRRAAERLRAQTADLRTMRLPEPAPGGKAVWWFLRARFIAGASKVEKQQFAAALKAEGMPATSTYTTLIYRQKWFRERNTFGVSQIPWTLPQYGREIDYTNCCPNAERAMAEYMLFGLHESHTDEVIDLFAEAMRKVDEAYRK